MAIQSNTMQVIPVEKERHGPQILAIFSAAISSFGAAAMFNWPSPAIPVLISEYEGINLELASYLSVIPPVITIIMCPIYAKIVEIVGCKYSLLSLAVLHLICWLLLGFGDSIYVLYVSRLLFGVADAGMFCALPIYISEVTTPSIRGSWGNAMGFFIYFGQFAINTVAHFCHIKTTSYIFALVPIIFFVTFMTMPESPYYLISKNKLEEAQNSLKKLRGSKTVDVEFEQIQCDMQRQLSETGTYKDILTIDSNRKGLLIAILARTIQQFSGITPFAVYTQLIFQEAGQNLDKGICAIIYTGILALANIFGSICIEKLGRKFSMTLSCFASGLALLSQAIYFYLKQNDLIDLSEITWFPLLAMILYVLSFSIGLGLVPILLLGELFSASIKTKASCIMTVVFMVCVSCTSKLFQVLLTNFGLHVPFALFAICTLIGTVLSYYLIPETKGKTLEEIQQMLKGNKIM